MTYREQRAAERRMRYKAVAGMLDFFGAIAAAILIVALIALLIGLYNWLSTDLTQSFSELQKNMTEALVARQSMAGQFLG
ncbi:MAG: hypothetical protein FWG37_02105 [Clostridia bacterium]|nr:hypothetical protein [Clostridia bacterium]